MPGEAEYRVTEFERYAARIETQGGRGAGGDAEEHCRRSALIANPTSANLGELLWRIGMPLSALVLALLAIPMSFVNPRAGRSVNLMFALLTYIVYSNLLSVSQARVAQGRLDFAVGCVAGARGMMLLLLLFMFAQRMQLIRLRLAQMSAVSAMRTLERYLARQIYAAVGFVLLGFLALFAFFDLIERAARPRQGRLPPAAGVHLRAAVGRRRTPTSCSRSRC